ncbi:MAG: aminotransferase class IV [Bacteroidia bacterium]|nr:aminotransferase class IV [Bacteroidia bacterium]
MYPLFESIKIEAGKAPYLSWHQERVNCSYPQLFGAQNPFELEKLIRIPAAVKEGLFKARFVYDEKEYYWEFHPYSPKKIHSLKTVEANTLEYSLKYQERTALKNLLIDTKEGEEIIILKGGFVTDSSYSNLIFRSGESWYTSDTPLLEGTCRARLLAERKIESVSIRKEDLGQFEAAKLINAMLDMSETKEIALSLMA